MLRRMSASVSLMLMAVLAAVPATMAQDKVTGAYELAWNGCFTAPGDEVPDWVGAIDLEGDVYDMVFFNLGDGRPPGLDLPDGSGAFIEIWAVYDGLELAYDDDCAPVTYAGDLVMWGHDAGVSDLEAQAYSMTGSVAEAFGDYADLAGQDVAMSGSFTMDDDGNFLTAPGALEIG
jgi:hypothetical protein